MSDNYCVSCGVPIPEGQRNCLVCYGDVGHGSDGYYLEMLREEERQEQERQEEERQMRLQEERIKATILYINAHKERWS